MRSFCFPIYSSCFKFRPLFSLLVIILCFCAGFAQTPVNKPASATTLDWETLRPEGEEFSVLMPKGSTFESSKEPYHKMELNTRMYIFSRPAGPVFAIVSLSGIKSNPALYTEMQRINSYVDAFKNLFAPKVRKDAVAKLTLVGEKTLQGNPGREYKLTIGDLSGTAQAFATRKRFYSVVYLNTKKDDSTQEQFLSSFVLPEKFRDNSASAASQTAEAPPVAQPTSSPAEGPTAKPQENENADTKPEDPNRNTAGSGKRHPISGGVLNGKAISLPKPDYPGGIDGVVVVQVTVDEQGNVAEARAVSGPVQLQQVSVNAALQAKFSPTLLMGEPVKVTGIIVYNFGRPQS
jgi:hypothetical protein